MDNNFIKAMQAFKASHANDTLIGSFQQYVLTTPDTSNDGLGYQTIYKFPNGYDASVVHGLYTYDLELAVLLFDDNSNYSIDYCTSITHDVIDHLTQQELADTLNDIREL
ncbi:hypothetical protein [Weissella viridescens]|uniref:hypothetical protein n=1 Tax=Weissella viridescens TaxID=1629 RepID=UPI003AF2FE47